MFHTTYDISMKLAWIAVSPYTGNSNFVIDIAISLTINGLMDSTSGMMQCTLDVQLYIIRGVTGYNFQIKLLL